jgi:hypothetical protein
MDDQTATTGHTDHVGELLMQWATERPDLDVRYLAIAARVARKVQ